MDEQGRDGQPFQRIAVYVGVGDEGVEVDAFSPVGDGKEAVDELGYEAVVLGTDPESSDARQAGEQTPVQYLTSTSADPG